MRSFNRKAIYLKAVTTWFAGYSCDVQTVQQEPFEKLRAGIAYNLSGVTELFHQREPLAGNWINTLSNI